MISTLQNKVARALSVIDKMSTGAAVIRSELESSLSEFAHLVLSLRIFKEQNKSTDLDKLIHKLLSPIGIVYSLLQDKLNGVNLEQLDFDDASAACQKIMNLLRTSTLAADNKSANLARETTSQTLTARSLANIR